MSVRLKAKFGLLLVLLAVTVLYLINLLFSQSDAKFATSGRWEPSISLTLVAAAAAVLPKSGNVLLWAADRGDVFGSNSTYIGRTITSIYDPSTGSLSDSVVSVTNHNMFCPGLSIDRLGRPIITGGSGDRHMSIYDEATDTWTAGPSMMVRRGYHSQTTLSDGTTFTIGGSWSGASGDTDGEIYDAVTNGWSWLHGCSVTPMLTNDDRGIFCADNHAWLFAWKDRSVFQAGPSSAMNWYGTRGNGSQVSAGPRGTDSDSMNGNAVVFDAVNGKILTLGGSASYTAAYSTAAAHIITLGDAFTPPVVQKITSMHYPRVFANSVVLPTGEVFVNGGASYAVQWTDANATLIPEMWSPVTEVFTPMAKMPIPRVYHSISVLLPDATVLTGGGGLCWGFCEDPTANHLDLQIFTPPYLFNTDGSLAQRPIIKSVSSLEFVAGDHPTVTTASEVSAFALVRYGSATHSINTDQRRIAFMSNPVAKGATTYQLHIPGDTGVVLPGYWMLFAMNREGVPSVATTVLVKED